MHYAVQMADIELVNILLDGGARKISLQAWKRPVPKIISEALAGAPELEVELLDKKAANKTEMSKLSSSAEKMQDKKSKTRLCLIL